MDPTGLASNRELYADPLAIQSTDFAKELTILALAVRCRGAAP
jgi:hypothetical protein